jgi:tRNA threonylcarbamoyladenosine biosynthesis protein TsaE
MFELVTASAEETEAFGGSLARLLEPGDVVLVRGELGSGKTTLVRGACRELGIVEPVTSPTFTIGHLYHGTYTVAHLDLYRFTGLEPAEWGDLEPYFDDAVVFVEWPEAGAGALPEPRAHVRLGHLSPEAREIRVDATEESLLQGIAGADPGLRHGD